MSTGLAATLGAVNAVNSDPLVLAQVCVVLYGGRRGQGCGVRGRWLLWGNVVGVAMR